MLIPVLLIVGIALMLVASKRRVSGKSGITDQQARSRAISAQNKQQVRSDMERLLVDLQELSRQINAGIDTRFCKLEVLINNADEKIRQLQELGSDTQKPAAKSPAPGRQPIDPERQMMYQLADSGKSPVQIAQATNKTAGEIELILALRHKTVDQNRHDQHIDHTID